MIKEEMQTTLDKRCVVATKTFNNSMWKYPDLSFTQDELRLWLQKNELLGLSLFKDLATLQGKEEVNLYVKTKDLIPGHVYYSGDVWNYALDEVVCASVKKLGQEKFAKSV